MQNVGLIISHQHQGAEFFSGLGFLFACWLDTMCGAGAPEGAGCEHLGLQSACQEVLCSAPSPPVPRGVLLWDFIQDFNVPHLQAEELGQQWPNPGCHPCAALFELPCLHRGDGHPYLTAFAGLSYLMAVAAL